MEQILNNLQADKEKEGIAAQKQLGESAMI